MFFFISFFVRWQSLHHSAALSVITDLDEVVNELKGLGNDIL